MVTECIKELSYYQERLDDVIRRERDEKGLIGVRIFVREHDDITNEFIARDVLALHDEVLAGNAVDITGKDI